MSFLDLFRPLRKLTVKRWKELGAYNSVFSVFGEDAYRSATVRACIRPLADFSAKAMVKCDDPRLERMLNYRPNMYMNGHDFLYKIRTRLELLNTAFIYLERNDRGQVVGAYPVPYSYFEALEYMNGLFIKFYFTGTAAESLTLPWEDLAVLRKDYNRSDISGDDNGAIIQTLQMMQTTNEGLANSIRATANLRGILKNVRNMLSPEDVKRQRDTFVQDYLNLENQGGIAALDSSQEFTPITMKPETATYEQMKEIRENIYRYFGVNDDIIMGNIKTEMLENFYKIRIQPFLGALSQELTSKIYTGKAAAFEKNRITYMAESGQFMTISQKIDMFSKVVLYGGMLIDEWRSLIGLGHIEGGDKPLIRLDAAHTNKHGRQMAREEDTKDPDDQEEEEDESEE